LIIEIVREEGEMARRPDLEKLCAQHGLRMCSLEQLIRYRLERDGLVRRLDPIGGTALRTPLGVFTLIAFAASLILTFAAYTQARQHTISMQRHSYLAPRSLSEILL
jgi:hypothetical protein